MATNQAKKIADIFKNVALQMLVDEQSVKSLIGDGARAYRLKKGINKCPKFSPNNRKAWLAGWYGARDEVSLHAIFETYKKEITDGIILCL